MSAEDDLDRLIKFLEDVLYRLRSGSLTPEEAGEQIKDFIDGKERVCPRCGMREEYCDHKDMWGPE